MKVPRRLLLAAYLAASAIACGNTAKQATTAPLYRPPANATIPFRLVFDNQMGTSFRFEELRITLDGGSLLTGEQHDLLRDRVRSGQTANLAIRVTPGEHTIHVFATFRGTSQSVDGYKFEIRSSRTFTAVPDGEVRIVTYEQSAPAIEERPAIRYAEKYAPPSSACSCACK